MKPANFPERKRQRQVRALARFDPPVKVDGESHAVFHSRPDVIAYASLKKSVDNGDQRSVRTKKPRDGSAAFRRA
jgi:hypothetical protein